MLITKDNPTGIDVQIQKFQELIHAAIMPIWGLDPLVEADNKKYESYGRCYRNRSSSGYIAEVYDGNKEYKDVLWNDTVSAISFFGTGTNVKHQPEQVETADVHLVYFVDLSKLKPSISTRADEEVRVDLLNVVEPHQLWFSLQSVETGIENVLREYPGSARDQRLKNVDMHPVHCFRLNFSLQYNKNNCTIFSNC